MSMMVASASEIEITSPIADEKYYVWDEVPITFTSTLGEGYSYITHVNGMSADIFAPKIGGKYIIEVLGINPNCEECPSYAAEETINLEFFPRIEETRIRITSPAPNTLYYVGDSVPIEFESPLTDRTDFMFNTYVIGPDKVKKLDEVWEPTTPGKYSIKVEAIGTDNGLSFGAALGCNAIVRE